MIQEPPQERVILDEVGRGNLRHTWKWLRSITSAFRRAFEDDGTLVFKDDATVWKDIMFPMAPPKSSGAGNPALVVWNGNLRGYSFAVNDSHDFDPQEIEHDAKIGATGVWHLHWVSRANDASERRVQWQLEYAIEPDGGVYPAPTVVSVEVAIPANTPVNTTMRTDIANVTIPHIARVITVDMKRIAATGTAPSVNPIVCGLHIHYEIDTVGSREITTK